MHLEVEEHRLVVALDADVETVGELSVHFAAPREQGVATRRLLDQVEHRTGGVGLGLVIEVQPGLQVDVDAAGEQRDVMCGAIGTPWALRTTPGLTVCRVHSPASKVVAVRPKLLNGRSGS